MVLQSIILTRHGFRANWESETPRPHHSGRIPPDTPLSKHGEEQAKELGEYLSRAESPVDVIYSSPFYRCLQTVEPLASKCSVDIRPELGFGEWYGMGRDGTDPQPASLDILKSFFSPLATSYRSAWTPALAGESIAELHNRAAYVLSRVIQALDREPGGPKCVLICTHAATLVALARALAGKMPSSPTVTDFIPYTACVTRFERREPRPIADVPEGTPGKLPEVPWSAGEGIGGRWECVENGNCSFLSSGAERGWRFSGAESFSHKLTAHGLDAGTGLGVQL